MTVAMQLLGVGKAAFHRFLAPGVNALAPVGQTAGIRALLGICRVTILVALALLVHWLSTRQ